MKGKQITILLLLLTALAENINAQGWLSAKDIGLRPGNTPSRNRQILQKAIDRMSPMGGVLYIEPVRGGYPMQGGIILRRNVTLQGAHGPTGRGTALPDRSAPTGSLFVIRDMENPFISVESATQIRGIQFYYPEQTWQDDSKIVAYPPTICLASDQTVHGVTLSCLTFYGEYMAMDFRAKKHPCEQILMEHCYGYPLSGEFIAIDHCYDIPRILHCHVNPANMREFRRPFSRKVIDSVVRRKTFTYSIEHSDNAQLMDVFTFGVYGGVYLGRETYGQLTNFNLDCVGVGIYKTGSQWVNRNWMIAQGCIIANVGERIEEVHPVIVEGKGHTSLTNVECFSGDNAALTTLKGSWDFITARDNASVTLVGCRMQGYKSDKPINISKNVRLHAVGCVDKDNNIIHTE